MKRFFTVLLLLLLSLNIIHLKAEDTPEDMSVFTIKILLQHCDQSDEIKVVRLKNTLTQRDGFCIQPRVNYKPSVNEYYKIENYEEMLYRFYNAYEILGKTDEAFITIQLMIWDELFDEHFTFDGKDASDYLKDEVLEILEEQDKPAQEIINEEVKVNEIRKINIPDLFRYDIISELTDIETDEDDLIYSVDEYSDETLEIELVPQSIVPKGAYVYASENSQDIYAFEGEYEPLSSKKINITVKPDDLTISFSKLDLQNDPINGAEFTLYKIDPQSDQKLFFLKSGAIVDLYEKLLEDPNIYERSDLSMKVSERYAGYIQEGIINSNESGYFPFTIVYKDRILKQGRIYVTDDINEDFVELNVEEVKTVETSADITNSLSGLKPDNRYYLCESQPARGYSYVEKPCQIISTYDDSYLDQLTFYNDERTYTLQLIKNNSEKTIALNGAVFRLTYNDEGVEKNYIFKTGSLNIFNEDDQHYVIYRYEDSDDIQIGEFNDSSFIKDDVPYGQYFYYLSNDQEIDQSRFDREVTVKEGLFVIKDLPYSANLKLEELEAPKGYHIDEAVFELKADIPYSEITFTNSRVNAFDIIPHNQRKIPKTCIGD